VGCRPATSTATAVTPPGAVRAAVVVPCHNEEHRLDSAAIAGLTSVVEGLVLVDDGSTDGTAALLEEIRRCDPARVEVLRLYPNQGKAEAVRLGLRHALTTWQPDHVAYLDADLATPPEELARLVDVARRRPELAAVIGSRVALLGHRVHRRALRHYVGRVYATLSSLVLGVPVYDTQCGAKVFRSSPDLNGALSMPFVDRWAFDVELLGRLLCGRRLQNGTHALMVEVPLEEWHDVAGSKVSPVSGLRSTLALLRVRRALASWEPAGLAPPTSGHDTSTTADD
jgi:dolichyl-phosphate beta-glucosyltransferase